MKKLTRTVIASALAAVIILALCSCGGASIQRGTIDGDVYTNEFAGLTFTKPSGWTYSTDEEIAQHMDLTAEQFASEDYSKLAADLATVYDMMVTDPETGSAVNVTFENLAMSGNTGMSEAEYLEALKTAISEQFKDLSYAFSDPEQVTLGTTQYTHAVASVSYSGMAVQQAIYLKKEGRHMIVISATPQGSYDIAAIEAMFS